jgi:alpha-tubulin suppressor-like RCC1 family protein
VLDLTIGWDHSFAILQDGRVYCRGENKKGELGLGHRRNKKNSPGVHSTPKFTKIYAGCTNTFARDSSGNLHSWGWNYEYTLGLGNAKTKDKPHLVLKGVRGAATGTAHTLAWMEDGRVMAWGVNSFGRLGFLPEKPGVPEFVGLPKKKVVFIGCGSQNSFALMNDGELWVWGGASKSRAGIGIRSLHPIPNRKWKIPRSVDLRWIDVFRWLFLGRADEYSLLYNLPVEVIFQTQQIFSNLYPEGN